MTVTFHGNGAKFTDSFVYQEVRSTVLDNPVEYDLPHDVEVITWDTGDGSDFEYTYREQGHSFRHFTVLGDAIYDEESWFSRNAPKVLPEGAWANVFKFFLLKDMLVTKGLPASCKYVLFADAYDVLVAGDIREAVAELERRGCDALFNAERTLWKSQETRGAQDNISSQLGLLKRYLNSGVCICRASELERMTDFVLNEYWKMGGNNFDDGDMLHRYYVRNYPRIQIDHESRVFHCLGGGADNSNIEIDGKHIPVGQDWFDKDIRLVVGIPTNIEKVPTKFFESVECMVLPPNSDRKFVIGKRIDIARQEIVDYAISTWATHLLFLDSDMMFPADMVQKMFADLKTYCNCSIICGLYNQRQGDNRPMLMREVGEWTYENVPPPYENRFISVDSTGCGAMLIPVYILRELMDKHGECFRCEFMRVDGMDKYIPEDVWFCKLARSAGYGIVIDTSAECAHLEHYDVPVITRANWDGVTVERREG